DAAAMVRENEREIEALLQGPHHGSIENSQIFLVMGHDGADGQLQLENDRLRIAWPGVGDRPLFEKMDATLKQASAPLGGVYLRDPIWTRLLGDELITVHPLGGCPMGEDGK